MDSPDAESPPHSLETARVVPIAELSPDLPSPTTTAVGGVVTITWPYNKVKGIFAFSLAEPDFRLRRNKGQVRIDFTGRAAKVVGDCGLGSNDEVLLSLAGAAWETEVSNKRRSLPGADLGWRLIFSESLLLKIKRAETSETDFIVVKAQPNQHETAPDPNPVQPSTTTELLSPPAPFSPVRTTSPVREISRKRFNDGEFASPAFVKRARMSYGSLFEDGFDIFQEDSGAERKRRKRTIFGRDSNAWRYTSHSPSPEPVAASPEKVDELVSSPTKVPMSDEGCQTMELDRSSPQPASASLMTHADITVSEHLPVIDVPSDAPKIAVTEQPQMPPLNDLPLETRAQNTSTRDYGEAPNAEVNSPQPYSDQPVSSPRNNFSGNPWSVDMVQSAFVQQHKVSFPPLHIDEPHTSSGFGNITSADQLVPFDESDSFNKSLAGFGENQESINDGIIPSTELHPPAFDYPPLDPIEETHTQSVHDEALTNYPASYLEDSRTSLPSQTIEEQTAQEPVVAESGTNSWATVNQISNATAMPPTDRLGSRDGSTPEHALVIDESDSDSDSTPEPMAVEDTLNDGRAYALDMYEDAEAEDEVDAQYSDDDEPEYDADEMGGDYDTRNYERPDDDDDGGYDEDPRPQHLEPEFDEGESWDEEEQEEFLDEEDEGEYLDEDVPEPHLQSVVRANPTVIDLISSSEDDSEDEDEDAGEDSTTTGIQGLDAHIDSRISLIHQKIVADDDHSQVQLNDDDSEIISQGPMSEADNSSKASVEDDEYASSYREEEVEHEENQEGLQDEEDEEDGDGDNDIAEEGVQEEGVGPKTEPELYEREEADLFELSRHQTEQHPERNTNLGSKTEPEGNAVLGGVENEGYTFSQLIPRAEILPSTATRKRREDPQEAAIEPLSAVDGLEMSSRAGDKGSSAHSHGLFGQTIVDKVVMESIFDKQSPNEPPEQDDIEMQDLLDNQLNAALEAAMEIDQIISSKSDTEYPPFAISHREPSTAAPSSPPPPQSLQSRIEGDGKPTFEEPPITSTAQIATTQLPTPLDTQVTETTLDISTITHMTMAESFDSYTTIERQDPKTTEVSITEKSVGNPAQQNIDVDETGNKQGRESTLIVELEAREPTHKMSTTSSPTPSFRTQVDDEEPAWPENEEEEQIKIDSQLNQGLSPEPSFDESDTNKSFTSHVDIDEELQASILENSLLEEYDSDDVHNELEKPDEPNQFDTNEASWESERTDQAETTSSSLHDNTPAKQLAQEISAQLRRNFVTNASTSGEDSDTSMLNDPSVHLARVANASKKMKRKSASSNHLYFPRRRTLDIRRSPTPDTDNSSLQLARASLSSQTPKSEEDSPSMTAAKLQLARHLRDELPDFCLLEALRQHVTKSLDVIAIAVMQPPTPRRARGGPREYMMSFTISDYSIGPYNVAEAFIYRPHKESLPLIKYGDVVLFRNFTVVSLAGKGFGLRSNDASSWAVFDYEDEPAQIRGPPVEYIQTEVAYVNYLREWFRLLDVKARARLERANRDLIGASKSK